MANLSNTPNTSNIGSNATNTTTGSNSNSSSTKRPLQLTNCHLIDCVVNPTTTSTSSNNAQQQQRYQARTVCWNASGSLLAVGCSDSTIRFWNPQHVPPYQDNTTTTAAGTATATASTLSLSTCKDVGNIHTNATTTTTAATSIPGSGGGSGPIIAAVFQPTSDTILCSMTAGSATLKLWDVRCHQPSSTTTTTTTTITATTNPSIITSSFLSSTLCTTSTTIIPIYVSVEWNPIQTQYVSCTTHDGTICIYDTRNISNTTTTTASNTKNKSTTATNSLVQQIQFPHDDDRIESCIFDRITGQYIMAGVSNRNHHSLDGISGGMGYIKVCAWNNNDDTNGNTTSSAASATTQKDTKQNDRYRPWYNYPAHAGPIYSIVSNRRGSQIATGGSDAVVGLWDTSTMSCITTISSRTKFIRSLSFSYDDQILAIATEEDVIELIDCTATATTSNRIGLASLSNNNNTSHHRRSSSSSSTLIPGVEDIAFHPTASYLLACARTNDISTSSGISSLTLAKLSIAA